MKTLAAALPLALLAACGSDDSSRPPLFGGFEPVDGTAVIFAPTVCTIPFVGSTAVSAVAVGLTSYADPCTVLTQTEFCGTRESSTAVVGVALSGLVAGAAVDPAGPGTYPFLASPPAGAFKAAIADAARVDPFCEALPGGAPDMSGGRIVLSAVSATSVAGRLDLAFEDGTSFVRDFDVAVCPLSVDLCELFVACFDYVCVPPP